MNDPHFLVRTIYLPRCLGFTLAAVLTVLLRGEALLQDPPSVLLVALLLIYPHGMYWLSMRSFNSDRGARLSMLVDSILVGLLIILNHFFLYAAVTYTSFLLISVAVIAGPLLSVMSLFTVLSVAGLGFWAGLPVVKEASVLVEAGFALALIIYPCSVARQVFAVTRTLGVARRHEKFGRQSLQATTEHLKRYISPQLFKALSTSLPDAAVTSRRRLTVCFTDLTGFTALMDSLPEDRITEVLNEYLNAMAEIAIRHGGTVDKFMGDGLMVFFGDPESRGAEKDALACVRMALEMRRRLSSMSRCWREAGIANQLKVRVGIHSGYCAVGNFGSEHRMDYTAVGGTVNIASRLEGCAPANGILISASTEILIRAAIEVEPVEQQQLKGIRRPVDTFRVIGERQGVYLAELSEQVPGLNIELQPAELDVTAAHELLQHCLALVEQQRDLQPGQQGVVRLLR